MIKLSMELRKSLQKLDALQKSIESNKKSSKKDDREENKLVESPDLLRKSGVKNQSISQAEDSWFDSKNKIAKVQSDVEESPLNKLNTHI